MIELYWMLESRCNYGCPYCPYPGPRRDRLVAAQAPAGAAEWVAAFDRLADRSGPLSVYISGGGEPTLRPDFAELVCGLARRHEVCFDTNLSWSWARLRAFAEQAPAARVRVDTSFHPSDAELGEFVEKAAFLRERGFRLQCRWVAWPPQLGLLPSLEAAFGARGLPFSVTPFAGTWEGRSYPAAYSEAQRAALLAPALGSAARGHDTVDPGLVAHLARLHAETPEGRPCRSGAEYACVMPDGSVHRCMQYAGRGWERMGGLLDDSWTPAPGPSPCRSPACAHEWRWLAPGAVAA